MTTEKVRKNRAEEKKANNSVSGLARLSEKELEKYEGKFVGIVNGKVEFSGTDATKVLKWVVQNKSPDKVFSSIPKRGVSIVK